MRECDNRRLNVDAVDLPNVDVVISTVPSTAKFTLPSHLLDCKPIVFDAAYRPSVTDLLRQASTNGCPCVQVEFVVCAESPFAINLSERDIGC